MSKKITIIVVAILIVLTGSLFYYFSQSGGITSNPTGTIPENGNPIGYYIIKVSDNNMFQDLASDGAMTGDDVMSFFFKKYVILRVRASEVIQQKIVNAGARRIMPFFPNSQKEKEFLDTRIENLETASKTLLLDEVQSIGQTYFKQTDSVRDLIGYMIGQNTWLK